MKRILSILLILVLALGVFAACQEPEAETPAATLDDAKTYLAELYKDSNPKPEKDFDVVGKVIVNGVTFTVTWTSSLEDIKIKESTKKDFFTVDLPDVNTEAKEYVLTATITDAKGATATVEVKKTLPVVANVSGIVTAPVEGTAYKLFFDQKSLGKVLFLLGEASNDQNKYVKTTIDPKEAPDFYVEVVEGGYKIYATVNNAKVYLRAATTKSDDGKISKYLGFDDKGTVFAYNADYDAWYSTIDGVNYVMGTYDTYDTASISEDSFYKTEENRLTQYAVCFITKAEGEAMKPTEGPEDPTEITSIADVLAIGAAKDNKAYTVEKYLVKGTIVEIKSAQYGNMYIQDEAGNKLYVYGTYSADGSTRFDAMNPQPKVGDIVTLMSIVGKYNDEVQLKNAWITELQAVACTNHVYDNACDADCNVCKETRTPADHVYTNACDADCDVCGATRTPADHTYDNACDATCNVCNATRATADHVDTNEDIKCDVCGADMPSSAEIEQKHVADTKAELTMIPADITADTTIELPATGKTFADTTITWVANGAAATIADGKVTFTLGDEEQTVTLTATIVCGEATATETFTVKVAAKAATAYIFGMYQGNVGATYYLAGGMKGYYMETTDNIADALAIYLEETNGGYYLYCFVDGAKTYINMVVSGTHVNGAYEATASTVYRLDAEKNTLIAVVNDADYWFGTRNDNTYTTVGPCKVEYNGFYCVLVEAGAEPTPPVQEEETTETPDDGGNTEATEGVVLSVDTLGLADQSYSAGTATVNGVAFEFVQMGNYGNGLQMRDKADKGTSMIWNTAAFGKKIARIELVYSSTQEVKYANADCVIFTFGNSVGEAAYTTKLSTEAGVKTYTITPDAADYTFFKLEHDLNYTLYWESITIVFAD